jgi:hypothetical protein
MSCPMGPCRTPAPPTPAPPTPDLRTASLHLAASLLAGRYRVGSPGCRTGAGCRRARTASTGLRGPPCRAAGHRAGTTGRGRAPRTRTPIAGADRRPRRQAGRHRAAPFPEDRQAAPFPEDRQAAPFPEDRQAAPFPEDRQAAPFLEDRQAVPFPEDRLRVRLAGVRSPTPPPGYPGNLEYPGLRCCASTRPPDRASMFPTAVSGSARRQSHRGR